jgi:hypothetical protein
MRNAFQERTQIGTASMKISRTRISTMCGAILFIAFWAMAAQAFSPVSTGNVTVIGKVSCGQCQGIQPLHKGYTRWTWALHSVSEGDDVVFVTSDNVYKLQGHKEELLQYMEDKVKVTGNVQGQILNVHSITGVEKNNKNK